MTANAFSESGNSPPKAYTEFEVQAVAYSLLLEAGYHCRGEYKWEIEPMLLSDPNRRRRGARFDLVILDKQSNNLRLVIEVKKDSIYDFATLEQCKHYKALTGSPVLLVQGMEDALGVVKLVEGKLVD